MPSDNQDKEFLVSLIEFYKNIIGNASHSVRSLKDVQSKFPNQYQLLLDLQNDPSKLLEITKQMDKRVSSIMINLFVRSSILSNKINNMFELTVDEKEDLAKDLESFSEEFTNSLRELEVISND